MLPRNDAALTADQNLQESHPVQSWLASSTLQKPSSFNSALASFGKSVLVPLTLGTDVQSAILGDRTNANKALHSSLEALDMSLANVDTAGQQSLDFVSSLAGQALSLVPFAGEAVGAGVVRAASPLVARVIPQKILEKQIPKLTARGLTTEALSVAANRSARYGAHFAGFMAPEDIEEAYDTETNSFNWGKAAISMTANGALGAFIPATQFLAGILGASFKRLKLGEAFKEPLQEVKAKVAQAVKNGDMTEEEGIWYVDSHENKDIPKIHEDAVRILSKKVPVDAATGKVQLNLMDEESTKNIQSAVTDQLFNDFKEPEKMAVTDYAIHKSADNVVGNHLLADGIDGWVGHIDEVFSKRAEKLAIDEEKIFSGIKDHMEFSQSRMARTLSKLSREESHASQLPYTIPDQVAEHLKVQEKIDELRLKLRESTKNNPNIIERKTITEPTNRTVNGIPELEVRLKSGEGSVIIEPKLDNQLKIRAYQAKDTFLIEEARGKGLGKSLYKSAIDEVLNKGYEFESDIHISPEAMRVYRSLEKNGYKFLENENYSLNKDGRWAGYYVSKNAEPIFKLISAPKKVSRNKQVVRRIEQLEKNQPKLMTPKEELRHLKEKLITNKGLTPFFEGKKDYHRLVELAHYWPQARRLLDRIHLHRAYDAQQVFRDILDNYSKLIKSNLSKFANPEKVVNYLKSRLEQTVNKEPLNAGEAGSVVKPEAPKAEPEPTPIKFGEDTELQAQRQEVEKSNSEQSKDAYFQSEKRLKQFKKQASALTNLIKCHLGTTNGEI